MDGGYLVEEGLPSMTFTTPDKERTKQFLSKVLK
jgi:ABC-type polar amino acid transport system ATPase subunit